VRVSCCQALRRFSNLPQFSSLQIHPRPSVWSSQNHVCWKSGVFRSLTELWNDRSKSSQFGHNAFFSHTELSWKRKNDRRFLSYFGQMIEMSNFALKVSNGTRGFCTWRTTFPTTRDAVVAVNPLLAFQGSLADYLKTKTLNMLQALNFMKTMATGLAFLHQDSPNRYLWVISGLLPSSRLQSQGKASPRLVTVSSFLLRAVYCCDRKSRAAYAQSFALWQQATIEFTCHDHSSRTLLLRSIVDIVSITRAYTLRSLYYCLFAPHICMVLFFAHIPFVVNHTIKATPPERLQQYLQILHILFYSTFQLSRKPS